MCAACGSTPPQFPGPDAEGCLGLRYNFTLRDRVEEGAGGGGGQAVDDRHGRLDLSIYLVPDDLLAKLLHEHDSKTFKAASEPHSAAQIPGPWPHLAGEDAEWEGDRRFSRVQEALLSTNLLCSTLPFPDCYRANSSLCVDFQEAGNLQQESLALIMIKVSVVTLPDITEMTSCTSPYCTPSHLDSILYWNYLQSVFIVDLAHFTHMSYVRTATFTVNVAAGRNTPRAAEGTPSGALFFTGQVEVEHDTGAGHVLCGDRDLSVGISIPTDKRGADLRKLIKDKNPNCLASFDEGQLYLHAARVDGSWISARDPDVSELRHRVIRVAAMLYNDNTRIRSHHLIADVFCDVRRSDLVVHVLVELLSKIPATDEDPQRKIGIDTVRMRHLEPYRNVAQRLKDHASVQQVENTIAKIVEQHQQGVEPVSFVVLENSSETGKTQMAFNLEASDRYEVFYVLASPIDEGEQPVYTAFFSRTVAFFACAGKDLLVLRKGSVREFKQRKLLYMYGLIAAALSGNDTFAGPASRADVEQLLHQRRLEKSKHCIFFLDEFPRVHRTFVNSNHELRILAMLNVFRSFGLPVVISSTTGTARKACLLGGGSRVLSGDPLVPWCVMIPSLPSVVLSDENAANEMIPNQIKRILRHSRPLFVAITLYFVRSRSAQTDGWIGFMCEMIDFLAPIFRAIKQMRPDEFELGQLGLLFGGSYGMMEENRNSIDCHYARLREVEPLELALGEEGVLLHNGKTWVAECDFPPSEDDMLLHLALLAGKDNEEAKKFQPLSGPLLKLLDEPSAQTIFNLNSSSQQASLRITAACMVLASRRDGVRGVNFPEFLGGLLYHLCIRETLEAAELPPELAESGLDQRKMPYLAPLNAKWPRWFLDDLEGSGLKFAEVISGDSDVCDSNGVISAASMEHRGLMSLQDVREALECIPLETTVHLVVTKKLLPLNIDSRAASDRLLPARLLHADIYHVSRESEMREIAGLETSARGYGDADRSRENGDGKLVLFIERDF